MTTKIIQCDICGAEHDFEQRPITSDAHFRSLAAQLGWTIALVDDRQDALDLCPGCSGLVRDVVVPMRKDPGRAVVPNKRKKR